MRIAIVGSGSLSVKLLEPILASNHAVVAAVLDGRQTRGIRRHLAPPLARYFRGSFSLGGRAWKYGIPTHYIDTMTESEVAPLKALNLDLILVGGFGIILKKPLLDIPRLGCLNTHSSLLPRHRGPNPFSAAILSGEDETGVSFHWMNEGIDTGDIVAQYAIPLTDKSTMLGLYRDACTLAGERIVEVLDQVEAGEITPIPQDDSRASYEKKCTVAGSWIDWTESAASIDRKVRGMSPQPYVRFYWCNSTVLVHRVTFDPSPVDAPPGTVLANRPFLKIATGSGTITLRVAFRQRPLPWVWPGPGRRPEIGDVLPSGSPEGPR